MPALLRAALALLAYAVAVTLAARGRAVRPRATDLLLDPAGALGAALLTPLAGAATLAAALAAGMLLHREPARVDSGDRFHRRMAAFQVRIFLSLLYFPLLAPFALVARLSADRFATPGGADRSHWRPARPPGATLEHARRQS